MAIDDPSLFTGGVPHEELDRMRAGCPVKHEAGAGDEARGYWSVTAHELIAAASRDTQTYSSYEAGIFLNPDQVVPLDLTRNLLLYKDPPDHTKFRKILQTAFVPKTVAAMEGWIRELVTELIDGVIERGSCDFVAEISTPMPLRVLARLMGLPDADVGRLLAWTREIEEAQQADEGSAALPTFMDMAGYLHEQIALQAEAGADTLVTRLRSAEVDGERLNDDEILVFFGLLVFAGNDTTRNTASSGMLALLENPDQWRVLLDDLGAAERAVEEILRFTSVVNYFCRTTTAEAELGGETIPAGEKVMLWYTAGSRDPSICPEPHRFDVSRGEQRHMAFGGGGRHFCLGAGLARLQLRILFGELSARMPEVRLAGDPERLDSSWANCLTSLPIEFAPGERRA
jgi:cholest-4-en-3-one 26-monooxygenase